MQLTSLDWTVLVAYGVVALAVGLYFAKRAGKGREDFFLAGRTLPWWVLGTSMVATTFSTDTPNLVTDLVRTGGVSGNWVWWAFVITGMCTVFFYARLWRRSEVLTDMGFYELRYSGAEAAFLRGFRALYLGLFFNVMIMATVTLAAIKIGGVMLGLEPWQVVVVAGTVTVLYSATSGLWGVVATDLILFVVAMVGSIAAAYYAVVDPQVGGLSALMSNPAVSDKLSFLPDFSDWRTTATVFIIPIAVQWWSTWYPGAEPGGGGYVAQRMLAAKTEKDSLGATLWFNIAHYALRPWPWILVALASLIIFPDLDSLRAAFPNVDESIIGNDLAYPAMLTLLPAGLLGLVVASLAAAYMSTVSTHLNWGASYMVDDFYRRFFAKDESEKHYVTVGRISTVILILLSSLVALTLSTAMEAFSILLQIGAGTGLVFLLRWFWWRVNAWSEISAMIISFVVAIASLFLDLDPSAELVGGVVITTLGWLTVTFLTEPTETATLQQFYDKIRPMGKGWAEVVNIGDAGPTGGFSAALISWFCGVAVVYGALFGTGFFLYGETPSALVSFSVAALAAAGLFKTLPRVALR